MKIEDLINTLEALAEEHPGIEVRLMTQSNWPFEYTIQGVTTTSAMDQDQDDHEEPEDEDAEPAKEEVVYLVEGTQLGYGRKAAWSSLIC